MLTQELACLSQLLEAIPRSALDEFVLYCQGRAPDYPPGHIVDGINVPRELFIQFADLIVVSSVVLIRKDVI